MKDRPDVLQGTLALMVLKTLDVLGPQHGYGIARRIEQISGDRRARFYRLTVTGRKQLRTETSDWERTAQIIERFFNVKAEELP
jgi:DNA-binding PadR family transcriptional regulator